VSEVMETGLARRYSVSNLLLEMVLPEGQCNTLNYWPHTQRNVLSLSDLIVPSLAFSAGHWLPHCNTGLM
jgi:hypothetical protein